MMLKLIIKNLRFYWQKIILTILLSSLLFFIALATWMFVFKIQQLSDKPLEAISTEIILEQSQNDKTASDIKTTGVIEPFNLHVFSKTEIEKKLATISQIDQISTTLIVWEFDPQNNKTIVGLDIEDPQVGLRKIESWLTPKSKFLSANNSQEVILERHFAKLFGYSLGGNYSINGRDFKIVGIVDFTQQSNLANAQVFMPRQTALSLLDIKDSDDQWVNQVYISIKKASQLAEVQKQIAPILPQFSITTKDQLLNNLSTFNKLTYQFGTYFSVMISVIAAILILWLLKVNRLEFKEQLQILRSVGWSSKMLTSWVVLESGLLLLISLSIAIAIASILYWGVLSRVEIGSLFSQNFSL